MDYREFNRLVKARQKQTNATLLVKGEEYSRGNNRLHNFYSAAAMNGETPEKALWGMLSKHIVSVKDMIDDTMEGIYPLESQVDEKLGDLINYIHLLEGLFADSAKIEEVIKPF